MKMLKGEKNRIGPEEIDKIRQEAASARAEGRSIFIFQINNLHGEGILNNPKIAKVEHDVMNMIEAVQIAGWSVVLPLSYTPLHSFSSLKAEFLTRASQGRTSRCAYAYPLAPGCPVGGRPSISAMSGATASAP